jgi:arsenate reductase
MDQDSRLSLLADPTRSAIVRLLLTSEDGRAGVTELADELGLRQPTLSHHLRELTEAGLVERFPEGRRVWHAVAPAWQEDLAALVGGSTGGPASASVLGRIIDDLAERFRGSFNRPTVARYVHESHDLLASRARITRYLASLTARFAADRLSALARSRGPVDGIPEVLFVCVENAGRSQMAAAIMKQLAGGRVTVRTAGSEPAAAVRQTVVAALDEIGVPLDGEFPKPLTDEVVRAADVVVTMGCGDACPVYPGRRYLDWELDDPAGQPLTRVRSIRDDIEARVRDLLTTLPA